MDERVLFGSREYWACLGVLLFARGADFLSTWIATPNLVLEANPLARRLGWKWGIPFNLLMVVLMASWPLPAIIVSTTSMLVAARNFQVAWAMRTAGEEGYRHWFLSRMEETPPGLFLFCLFAQVTLVGLVGLALVVGYGGQMLPFGIGLGILAYAMAVLLFTVLALWRQRRVSRRG